MRARGHLIFSGASLQLCALSAVVTVVLTLFNDSVREEEGGASSRSIQEEDEGARACLSALNSQLLSTIGSTVRGAWSLETNACCVHKNRKTEILVELGNYTLICVRENHNDA